MPSPPDRPERALVLAPHGRDAAVARDMLGEAGIAGDVVRDLDQLVTELETGAGFALITEEALASADLQRLAQWIEAQPEWSDFPFVLLTRRGGGLERNPAAGRYLEVLGNVTFLERPFHPTTLISLARSARRARRRQYDARLRLEELNQLASDLERRVEQRTAEHEIAIAQLHEAQKLETLGQLTGGVAHDFNNLLTPITGALDLLQRKLADGEPRTLRLIGNALQAAERAKTLVQRLLGFARRQSLQTQAIDLTVLIGGMRDLIASSLGPTVEFHLRYDADLPLAAVDPNQLELAILNLCVNARDAMPGGGTLLIQAREVAIGPQSEPKLRPGLYIKLSVIDSGCGMSEDTLSRAVEPFYSTKEVGRGTGLGLSMVHGLAAQLGGGFALSSQIGEGTRADLYLPVAEADAPTSRIPPSPQLRWTGRQLSILLVDDEEIVRVATAEMFRDLGHRVEEAGGGAEALEKLDAGYEADVLVTDYKMPRMDGAELARRARAKFGDLPVLLITGYTGVTDDVLDLPRLEKPFGQSDISSALAGLFQSGDNVVSIHGRGGGKPKR